MNTHRRTVILNVNDNEATRYALSRMLESGGVHEVIEAGNGAQALAAIEEKRVDLVLLDVRLPDMSGLEVCRRIKADPKSATVVVLHLSAFNTEVEQRVEGLAGGADGYLSLPVDARELLATIDAYLRARGAEESALNASAQWSATFEALSDAVCLTDAHGFVARWNGAFERLTGRPRERIQGRTFREATGDALGVLELASAKSTARDAIDVARGQRWFAVTGDPVTTGDRVTGRVYVVREITSRKAIEQELREAEQRKDLFIAMLAHELRNPLAAASIALHLLDRRLGNVPESEKPRLTLRRQLGSLERMVDDLLDVSRLTRGKITLKRESMDVVEAVKTAVAGVGPSIAARGQRVVESYPDKPFLIVADAERVQQIVSNLVDNACKYGVDGGRIEVVVRRDRAEAGAPDWATVEVADDGAGISPELLPKVFDAFSQAEQSRGDRRGGLGIGLTIVKSLVEMHGGESTASSDGLGKGARMRVRFPVAEAVPATEPAPAPSTARGRRVLLVEDNADLRETLLEMLGLWGHSVRGAADGPSGIESVRRDAVDVALIDIGLPGADGYDVARAIRQDGGASGHPILVAMTGYGSDSDREQARAAGFDRHLTKPVDPKALSALLEEL